HPVPAPANRSPRCLIRERITSTAPGTVMVISTIGIPPRAIASAARRASSPEAERITGTIPTSTIRWKTSALSIAFLVRISPTSSRDTRVNALHHLQYFLQSNHRCITGGGHGQCAVSCAEFDRHLRLASGKQAIYQPGGERIAAADTIKDFQVVPPGRFVKLALAVAQSTKITHRGCFGF